MNSINRLDFTEKVLRLTAKGHPVTLLGIPGMGKSDFIKDLSYLCDNSNLFIKINCSDIPIISEDSFYKDLGYELYKELARIKAPESTLFNLKEILNEGDAFFLNKAIQEALSEAISHIGDGAVIRIILTDLTKLSSLPTSFFNSLRSIRKVDKDKVSLIFVNRSDLFTIFNKKNAGELYDLLISSILWIPFPDKDKYCEIVRNCEDKFQMELTEEVVDSIYDLTRGHSGLVKYLMLFHKENPDSALEESIEYIPLKSRLERIEEELPIELMDLLLQIATKNVENLNKDSIEELLSRHLIYPDESGYSIMIPLLSLHILKYHKPSKNSRERRPTERISVQNSSAIKIVNQDVYMENELWNINLTSTEFSILSLLVSTSGGIVTRDEIADMLWGKDKEEKYSEWAIDQSISRLRKKMGENGYAPKYIKTLKGRGFKLLV